MLEVRDEVRHRGWVRGQQALVNHDEGQIHGAGPAREGIAAALELVEQRPGLVLRRAHGDGKVLMDQGHVWAPDNVGLRPRRQRLPITGILPPTPTLRALAVGEVAPLELRAHAREESFGVWLDERKGLVGALEY